MFILRQINKEGLESNLIIGDYYVLTLEDQHPKRFKEWFETTAMGSDSECYGYLTYKDGTSIISLFKDHEYYIMTESGRTFKKLNF